LLIEFLDYVKEIQPKYFIVENVPGLNSKKYKKYIDIFKEKAKKIGYCVYEPIVLNSVDYLVPQKRKRLFLVGYKTSVKKPKFPPSRLASEEKNLFTVSYLTVKDAIGDLPSIDESFQKDEFLIDNWNPNSPYQAFLGGLISLEEFKKELISNSHVVL